MKCKKSKELIVLSSYGELSEREDKDLRLHLDLCTSCRQDATYTKKVVHVLDRAGEVRIPDGAWDTSWAKINQNIQPQPKVKRYSFLPSQRAFGFGAAALILVFTAGLFLGRIWSPFGQDGITADVGSQNYMQLSIDNHIEDIRPILVEYANYSSKNDDTETLTVNKDLIQQLLVQNVLLKRSLTKDNPAAQQILEDMEIVLREIGNQPKEDNRAQTMIKDLISQRDILYRMNSLKSM